MQLVSSMIWTCVAVSISNDDNHYTTGTTRRLMYDEVDLLAIFVNDDEFEEVDELNANKESDFDIIGNKPNACPTDHNTYCHQNGRQNGHGKYKPDIHKHL